MQITSASARGPKKYQQDSSFYIKNKFYKNGLATILVIADGISSRPHGDLASKETCKIIRDRIMSADRETDLVSVIDTAIKAADTYCQSCRDRRATTVVVALIDSQPNTAPVLHVLHAGNSRAYLYHGKIIQLTKDHNEGHHLYNAVGFLGLIDHKTITLETDKKHIIVLTTDGVHNYMSSQALLDFLDAARDLEDPAAFLITQSLQNTRDNATAIICIMED